MLACEPTSIASRTFESVRLVVREVRIAGNAAFADYVIESRRMRVGEAEPPSGGRFSFRRAGDRWLLTGNRFDEAVPSGR